MIYAFTGKKQSGKSTASAFLQKKFSNAIRLNFKSALVDELVANFPKLNQVIIDTMERLDYDGNNPWTLERLVNEKPPLFRALMQNYGTEVRRGDDPNYWVDRWKYLARDREIVITDDVRFLNEAQAVKELGGVIIKIVREDMPDSGDSHVSEQEMDEITPDYLISVKTGEHQKLYDFLDYITNISNSNPATYESHGCTEPANYLR